MSDRDIRFAQLTRGSQVLGKVFGAGSLWFTSTPGDYLLTFVASPSSDQLFGLTGSEPTSSSTATAPAGSSHGGGAAGLGALSGLLGLVLLRIRRLHGGGARNVL